MSSNYSSICSLVVEDMYGLAVCQVGDVLMKMGPLPFPKIFHALKETKIPVAKLKECLKILIQHNIVTFKVRPGFVDPIYIFHTEAVFQMLRYPQYFDLVETQLGQNAKMVLEEVIRVGQISITNLLFILGCKFRDHDSKPNENSIREKIADYFLIFKKLTKNKYCIRCDVLTSDDEATVPLFKPYTSEEEYFVPNTDFNFLVSKIISDSSVKDLNNSDKVIWKLNADTFHLEMKNGLLVDAMKRRLLTLGDERVFKVILKIGLQRDPYAVTTPAVSVVEIKNTLKKMVNGEEILRYLDQQLEIMEEDPLRLVVKTSDANSGLYIVNVKTAFVELMWTTIEEIIIERHGYHAARIFRLIKKHKFVDQDRLNELGMIPGKDAKCLTYKLVEDNFIILKEIRKTYNTSSNTTMSKTAHVFSVDILQIVHAITEWCYRAMMNARIRLTMEREKQRGLLTKESRIERILSNMKKTKCTEEQFAEVRAMITPPEREVLNKVHYYINTLTAAMLRADHTVFLIKIFLLYNKLK